jgi:hypothetical protein
MKTYSDTNITREEVVSTIETSVGVTHDMLSTYISGVDAKQTAQIDQLRFWLGASFLVNLLLTLGVYLIK